MKNKKIILGIITFFLIFSLLINISYASGATDITLKFRGVGSGDDKAAAGYNVARNILGTILNVTRIVGAAVAICILLIIACKYMLASAGDRADIKKYAINYVVGAIILFSASAILGIIKQIVDQSV